MGSTPNSAARKKGSGSGKTGGVGVGRGRPLLWKRRGGRRTRDGKGPTGGSRPRDRREPRGPGKAGRPWRRPREPRTARRNRAGGALGARRGDARLPLSEGLGLGRGVAGVAHAGGSAVPSPSHCRRPQLHHRFRGVGRGGGSGRGTARLQWLLRVTERAGPGSRKRHACADAAEEAEAGAVMVAREGEG